MINIDKYRMNGIEFSGDAWEFINSLVYLKYGKKINILELGEGNYSLLFAICREHFDSIKKILSVDVKNKYKKGEKNFYEKKRIFSALDNRNYEYVEHFQGDCFSNDILSLTHSLFSNDSIHLFIIEYMIDDDYMNKILDVYSSYFDDNVDIYYHNLHKNKQSELYFEKIAKNKKQVILDNGNGIGIIKIK
jgi:hypothetical protein